MRGSSEPVRINMVETCPHVSLAVEYNIHEFREIGDHARCEDCNIKGKNLQLCLAKDCKKITCSNSSYDHSQRHHHELRNHVIYQNLYSQKLVCYACNRETIFPDRRMVDEISDSDDSQVDAMLPKGLQNIGNTCYMNSALQALCNIPPLREHFTKAFYPLGVDEKKRHLSRNFQRLVKDMCNKDGPDYLVPNGILHGIRNVYPMFRGYQQHDTQEFLRCFMDQLHEEMKDAVPEVPHPMLATMHGNEDVDEEPDDDDQDQTEGRPSSGSQSEYESCDSGVSERSSLSDEGERSSMKRKMSANASPPPRCKLPFFRTTNSPGKPKKRPPKYRSIISDLFDGKLLSSVQCLICHKTSSRIETFQDLSLPIPSRDHVAMLHQGSLSPQTLITCNDVYKGKPTWVSWLWEWVKSWFYGPTISLHDCLAAFFSSDELKGDNMYSCEQCAKLRNGVKFSEVIELPEVLCIHLKRFRHELAFPSKIANFVSFPLTDLDMRPYLHEKRKNAITVYDLSSVICHHGTANGGHYTCFAINPSTGQWYELDDHCVVPVSVETVSNAEGYVLFYRKKNEGTQKIWNQFLELMSNINTQQTFMDFYVSRQWVNRLETFAEPGPIDNSDFLCPHGQVQPTKYSFVDEMTIELSAEVWEFLYDRFKGGPACNELLKCEICEEERNRLRKRMEYEAAQYSLLVQEGKNENASVVYALSWSWFRQWEAFVQGKVDPPGPIDNTNISTTVNGFKTLKKGSDYGQFPHELWSFFKNTYGGGPELVIKTFTRGPSRASDSGISMDRDRIIVSASKAKSVESLPVNLDCSNDPGIIRDSYNYSRTHSVSSDNVTIKMAATSASHKKQQSLDNVRSVRVENENQRDDSIEDNAYCPAFTPDELDSYIPFQQANNNSMKVPI